MALKIDNIANIRRETERTSPQHPYWTDTLYDRLARLLTKELHGISMT